MRKFLALALLALSACMPDKDCIDPRWTSRFDPEWSYVYFINVGGGVMIPINQIVPAQYEYKCADGRKYWSTQEP